MLSGAKESFVLNRGMINLDHGGYPKSWCGLVCRQSSQMVFCTTSLRLSVGTQRSTKPLKTRDSFMGGKRSLSTKLS